MSAWEDFHHVGAWQKRGVLNLERLRGRGRPRFRQESGSRPADILTTTAATPTVVSERFRAALDGFSGWSTRPIEIELRDGTALDGYALLRVEGRAGPIDHALSERVMRPPAVPGGVATPGLRGLRFDPASWDGSDVFKPADTALVFVTGAVAAALRRAKLTNVLVEPIDAIEFSDV